MSEQRKHVIWLSCAECAMSNLHQPCEACPNRKAQGL
jgi:hypothetical protein